MKRSEGMEWPAPPAQELQLTDAQIEAAAKLIYGMQEAVVFVTPNHPYAWEQKPDPVKGEYRKIARAAAPFLQAPWAMPTREEEIACFNIGGEWERGMCGTITGSGMLRVFIERRNAALLPKPADPRRAKIADILIRKGWGNPESHDAADRIIAALDAKE